MPVNFHKAPQTSSSSGIYSKVKTGIEYAAMAKQAFDIGKSIYTGVRAIAPMVASVAPLAAL